MERVRIVLIDSWAAFVAFAVVCTSVVALMVPPRSSQSSLSIKVRVEMTLHRNVASIRKSIGKTKCAASGSRTPLDSYAAAPGLRSLLGRLYVRPSFVFDRTLLSRRRVVGQNQGVMGTNSPRWNRCVGIAEAIEHFSLFTSGHQPQNTPSTIDDRVGQGHPTSSLVDAGQPNICAGDTEDRISRNQRGGVAIAAETQMNEIKYGR